MNHDIQHVKAALQKIPLRLLYKVLNKRYFHSRLPNGEHVTLRWKAYSLNGYWGCCWSNKNGIYESGRGNKQIYRGKVLIELYYNPLSKNPSLTVPLLLHEMIHGYLGAVFNQRKERHGAEFKTQVERIRGLGGKVHFKK